MSIDSIHLKDDPLPWLLALDSHNPGVRYTALQDVMRQPEDDRDVCQAKADIRTLGPVPAILGVQHPEGYWAKPGGGHTPSYRATVWQIIFLAELGADPSDERVRAGCEYLLSHNIAANGAFAMSKHPVPSSVVHCFNGDPLFALLRQGYGRDPRVETALDWQVRAIILVQIRLPAELSQRRSRDHSRTGSAGLRRRPTIGECPAVHSEQTG